MARKRSSTPTSHPYAPAPRTIRRPFPAEHAHNPRNISRTAVVQFAYTHARAPVTPETFPDHPFPAVRIIYSLAVCSVKYYNDENTPPVRVRTCPVISVTDARAPNPAGRRVVCSSTDVGKSRPRARPGNHGSVPAGQ